VRPRRVGKAVCPLAQERPDRRLRLAVRPRRGGPRRAAGAGAAAVGSVPENVPGQRSAFLASALPMTWRPRLRSLGCDHSGAQAPTSSTNRLRSAVPRRGHRLLLSSCGRLVDARRPARAAGRPRARDGPLRACGLSLVASINPTKGCSTSHAREDQGDEPAPRPEREAHPPRRAHSIMHLGLLRELGLGRPQGSRGPDAIGCLRRCLVSPARSRAQHTS